ncbi:MAG: hypothetical protein NXY57DRAFT_966944 [Lentinula lateritia]|nr:MAG: hypothetical protein NXY57DRAFT_966944 [Lentinula lateritia]
MPSSKDLDDRMSGTAVPSLKRGRSPEQSGKDKEPDRVAGVGSSQAAGSSSLPGPSSAPGPSISKKPRLSKTKRGKKKQSKYSMKQKAPLQLHIRVLWNLLSQNALPQPVSPTDIAAFNQRFAPAEGQSSMDHIEQLVQGATAVSNHVLSAVQAVKQSAFLGRGIIAKNASRIEDSFLERIFSAVAALGLEHWSPDIVGGHPDSVYNLVHEQIAISTFKMLLSSFVYRFLQADMAVGRDDTACVQIYRNFVFGHIGKKVKDEMRKAGSVEMKHERINTYKRVQQIKDESFRPQVLKLVLENESHSDDELDSDVPANNSVYLIRKKVGRANKVNTFFRIIDARYESKIMRLKGQRAERSRKDPTPEIPSLLTQTPKDVPIDFFDPEYFNNFLSVKERAHYAHNGVALPLEEHCINTRIDLWKNLPEDKFMQVYGNAVLAQYKIPTQEELDQLDEYELDESDSDEA